MPRIQKMLKNNMLNLTKKAIKERKKSLSFDTLGRSLSSNPFMPKDIFSFLNTSDTNEILVLEQISLDYDYISKAQAQNTASCIIKTDFKTNLDEISYIRRYIEAPLIQDDIFIDKYQILESLVFGADGVMLDARMLSLKDLKELSSYAEHLGMQTLIKIESKNELMNAILSATNIISIYNTNEAETKDIISSIPSNKIILINDKIKNHISNKHKIFIRRIYNG